MYPKIPNSIKNTKKYWKIPLKCPKNTPQIPQISSLHIPVLSAPQVCKAVVCRLPAATDMSTPQQQDVDNCWTVWCVPQLGSHYCLNLMRLIYTAISSGHHWYGRNSYDRNSQNLSYLVVEVKAAMLAWRWCRVPTNSKLRIVAPNSEQVTKTHWIYSKI